MSNAANSPSQEEVTARAQALASVLAERSAESQQARQVPDAVIAHFIDAGLNRIMQPVRFGGWDMGVDAHSAAAFIFGKGDASQGWTLTSFGENAHVVGHFFSEQAQDEIWGSNPAALVAGKLAPGGKGVLNGDTLTLSGQWSGNAGIDHADWLLGGVEVDGGDARQTVYFIVPKSEAKLLDDWQVAGLESTGAKSFTLENVTVPAHRVLKNASALNKRSSLALAAVPLGTAAAMIELFAALCQDTVRRGRRTADNFATALRIAESKGDIDAGILSVADAASQTMALVKSGEGLSAERRALNGVKASYAAMIAARAAERVFIAAGAKAILLTNPMQRFLLDINCLAAQDVFDWDRTASDYGLIQLGSNVES